jgi:hypothetical protein
LESPVRPLTELSDLIFQRFGLVIQLRRGLSSIFLT